MVKSLMLTSVSWPDRQRVLLHVLHCFHVFEVGTDVCAKVFYIVFLGGCAEILRFYFPCAKDKDPRSIVF